jgi:hypothetical protein
MIPRPNRHDADMHAHKSGRNILLIEILRCAQDDGKRYLVGLPDRTYQPRVCSKSFSSIWRMSSPFIASPNSSEASSTAFGSL